LYRNKALVVDVQKFSKVVDLVERQALEFVDCQLKASQINFGSLLRIEERNVLLNIYFHGIALLLERDQALFSFCFVVFVLELSIHHLEELCAAYLLMVKAVQQKVFDQLYLGMLQDDLTFR
jgi:hypothetical protein